MTAWTGDPMLTPLGSDEERKLAREAVLLDKDNVSEEFEKLSGHLAYFNARLADICEEIDTTEDALAFRKAQIGRELRERAAAGDGSKVHEYIIDQEAALDDAYRLLRATLHTQRKRKAYLFAVVESIRVKKDTSVSLGATQRQEAQGNPRIMRDPERRR